MSPSCTTRSRRSRSISLEDTGPHPGRQGGARHPRGSDRTRRAAAGQPLGRAQGARPPAGRHRDRPGGRADSGSFAARRGSAARWTHASGSRSPSAGWPPTTGWSFSRRGGDRDHAARLPLPALQSPRRAACRPVPGPRRSHGSGGSAEHRRGGVVHHAPPRRRRASARRSTSRWSSSEGGARLFCHGEETRGREDRLARRGGERGFGVLFLAHGVRGPGAHVLAARGSPREKVAAISKSLVQGLFKRRSRGQG